jgi:A/G-specific adenine glycosylase
VPAAAGRPARYVRAVEDLLLAWFGEHGRDLPWRRTRDPYAILVSEVMAQQYGIEIVDLPLCRLFRRLRPESGCSHEPRKPPIWALVDSVRSHGRPHELYAAEVRLQLADRSQEQRAHMGPRDEPKVV